jgi:hypothetical protein
MVSEFNDTVMRLYNEGKTVYAITKENPRLTNYWVNKILAHNKVKETKK